MKRYLIILLGCLALGACSSTEVYNYIEEGERFSSLPTDRTDEEKKKEIQENLQMTAYLGISLGLSEVPLYGYEIDDILNKDEITIAIDKNNEIVKVKLPLTQSKRKLMVNNREEDIRATQKIVWTAVEELFVNNYEKPFEIDVEIVDVDNEILE